MEEIDLKEVFRVFWQNKATIILLVAIFMVLGFIYSSFILVPKYQSYTTLLLAQSSADDGKNTEITTTDLTLNSKLIATYSDLVKSTSVIRKVKENLSIEDSENSIKASVSVKAQTDNNIMKITVTNTEPEKTARIANEVAAVFIEQAKERFNLSNIYTVDAAEVNRVPSNVNHVRDIVIFSLVGFVLAATYVFIVYMLDNSVKSQDDVEKNTHIPVLASIPTYETEQQIVTKNKKQKSSKGGNKR